MELFFTPIILCLLLSASLYFVYKTHQDLKYCINEHYKQKRQKEYNCLMEDIQRNRDFEALQWFSYEREKAKGTYKGLGLTEEEIDKILGPQDIYYNELSNNKYR